MSECGLPAVDRNLQQLDSSAGAGEVGALLAASDTSDVIDAHVAIVASTHHTLVMTSDVEDFEHLATHLPHPIGIEHV